MRTARQTRRQIEAASEDLVFDALAVGPAGVDALVAVDEVATVADLLGEFDYGMYDVPEFDLQTRTLAEFEAAITPAPVEVAPVLELAPSWPVAGLPGQGKATGDLSALYGFGEVA